MFKPDGEKITGEPQWKKNLELQKEEVSLKNIVEKNFEKNFSKEKRYRPDLIDNFHWVIMRVRRMKKITQEQLAKEISEPITAIKLAEEGILPNDDNKLVKKLENFLGITLIKEESIVPETEVTSVKVLKFEPNEAKNLTIADLKKMKEMKNPEAFSDLVGDFSDFDLEEQEK